MTYALTVTLIAIALAILTVYMAVLESKHRSLIAEIEAKVALARSLIGSDAKAATGKLDAVIERIKSDVP